MGIGEDGGALAVPTGSDGEGFGCVDVNTVVHRGVIYHIYRGGAAATFQPLQLNPSHTHSQSHPKKKRRRRRPHLVELPQPRLLQIFWLQRGKKKKKS